MATSIKITELTEISYANVANIATSVIPIVEISGTDTTYKGNINNIANLILGNIGNGFVSANVATTLTNGTSNVRIASGSTVTISVGGASNLYSFTSTGANITGTANVSGNANVGNLGSNIVVATGNVTGANVLATSFLKTGVTVVGSLPSAATAGQGARYYVTDAANTVFWAALGGGGGGSNVSVVSDGTIWRVG